MLLRSSNIQVQQACRAGCARARARPIRPAVVRVEARRGSSTLERPAPRVEPGKAGQESPQGGGSGSGGGGGGGGGGIGKGGTGGTLRPQVFISHTGQDDKAKTFAACILLPALQAAGFPVFMDFANLEPGCQWPSKLLDAASNSTIVVAVLSKKFPKRLWCMQELHVAYERQLEGALDASIAPLIIPVFYDAVKDVCLEDSVLEQLWSESGELYNDTADCFRRLIDAQSWARNIRAMETHVHSIRRRQPSQAPSKDEDLQLALKVVSACIKSGRLPPPVDVGYVVGFDEQLAEVASELVGGLKANPPRLGVWLHGPGGTGKTKLAKMLYAGLTATHELPGLTPFTKHAIVTLDMEDGDNELRQHLRDMLHSLGANNIEGSLPILKGRLQHQLTGQKVLLVIDNVCDAEQLDALLPTKLAAGSMVVITSRDTHKSASDALVKLEEKFLPYKIKELACNDAVELLCHYAKLPADVAKGSLHTELQNMVQACAGLPLALRVMGAALRGTQDPERWKNILAGLRSGDRYKVDRKICLERLLLYSFETLSSIEQEMFLDVATVLAGQPQQLALLLWEAWHKRDVQHAFNNLVQRSLLEPAESNLSVGPLKMHDVLRYLGRGIVRGCYENYSAFVGSRLFVSGWYAGKDLLGTKTKDQIFGFVEGKRIVAAQLDVEDAFTPGVSSSMLPSLPLQLNSSSSSSSSTLDFSSARVLRLGREQPRPPTNPPPILWLDAHSAVDALPWLQGAQQLTVVRDVAQVPYKKCMCPIVTIRGGGNSVPPWVGQLPMLHSLVLVGSFDEDSLNMCLSTLTCLEGVALIDNNMLLQLPAQLLSLPSLKILGLLYCSQLQALPDELGRLKGLTALSLEGCQQLQSLPPSICDLKSLHMLFLNDCSQLQDLPAGLGSLPALDTLSVVGCTSLHGMMPELSQIKNFIDV